MYLIISTVVFVLIVAVSVILMAVRYKRLKYRKCCRTLLLIPVVSDDTHFEQRVKSCYWEEAFSEPALAKDIILVIMQESANAFAARRLAQEYPSVHTVHFSSLSDYLQRNYSEYSIDDL